MSPLHPDRLLPERAVPSPGTRRRRRGPASHAVAGPVPAARTVAATVARATATGATAQAADVPPSVPRRRLPASVRRRPSLYVAAAALVAGIGLSGGFSSAGPAAQAGTAGAGARVSVADQLGIRAETAAPVVDAETTERLGELVASRAERDAEEAQAARIQTTADRAAVKAARRAAAAAAEAARPDVVLPVEGARLTSGFGARWGTLHGGIDLAAPMRTPEYAAMDGVVLEAGPASGFGLAVYVQHENGDVTVYGHMDEILVSAGQVVRAGDTIALLGNTGQSTGPHLHFEVHQGGEGGTKIDPIGWLRDRGVDI